MESTVMSNESKLTLQNMVKNIAFVDSLDDLKPFFCQSCGQVAIIHHIAKCGHIFCERCYFKIYQKPCLVEDCKNELIDELTHDAKMENDVFSLKVSCPFQKFGCDAKIPLNEYFVHQGSCDHLMEALLAKNLKIPDDAENIQKMKGDILECNHAYEDLNEKLATDEELIKSVELNVKKLQVDLVLTEERLCVDMEKFVASELEKHIEMQNSELKQLIAKQIDLLKTELETKECERRQEAEKQEMRGNKQFEKQNQEFLSKLQELEKTNENLRNELQQLKDTIKELQNMQIEMNNKIKFLESQQKNYSSGHLMDNSTEFLWEVPRFHEVLKNLKNSSVDVDVESNSFPTKEFGYQMKAKLKCHKEHLSMYVSFTEETKAGNPLVYFHRRTFIIVDQSNQLEKRDVVRTWEPKFGSKLAKQWMKGYWGSLQLAPISLLEKDQTYLKNDALLIKIIIEPLTSLYRNIACNDGVLLWKVDDYRKKKQAEMDGVIDGIRSEYFYSHQRGYRLQIELCLNGYGDGNRGEYLAAFVWFRRGEWDDFLSKNFPHRITITIFDRLPSEEETSPLMYSYSFSEIKNRCFSRVVLQSKIEQPKYLKNDSLLIQVVFTAQ